MARKIGYQVNPKKAIETIVLLSTLKPNIDLYNLGKVIFYAEKDHINHHARPIIGDRHICSYDGPFPSKIRDIVQRKERWLDSETIQSIDCSISVSKDTNYPRVTALRAPDMDVFSETDINCLVKSLEKYGSMSFPELKDLSHEEPAYRKTKLNDALDYAHLVDESNIMRAEVLQEIEETAPNAVL